MLGLFLFAAIASAATATKTFSDDPSHYVVTVPAGCTIRPKSGNTPTFIDCGKGYVRVAVGPGSDLPSLQKVVNTLIGSWNNLKLLENTPAGKLGGLPSRVIYAEGTVGGQPGSIEMLAATRDGRWYVLAMASPQNEWVSDGARYFAAAKTGFRFVGKPATPKKK
jgi:hypothetical protein